MKNKLKAIWILMWSEHYMVMTTDKFCSCYPSKITENTKKIKTLSELFNKQNEDTTK